MDVHPRTPREQEVLDATMAWLDASRLATRYPKDPFHQKVLREKHDAFRLAALNLAAEQVPRIRSPEDLE